MQRVLGCELVTNNELAMHFADCFGMDIVYAGILTMSFGVFARSLGGLRRGRHMRTPLGQRRGRHMRTPLGALPLAPGQAVFRFGFGLVG